MSRSVRESAYAVFSIFGSSPSRASRQAAGNVHWHFITNRLIFFARQSSSRSLIQEPEKLAL
jgi:hypothetical protein